MFVCFCPLTTILELETKYKLDDSKEPKRRSDLDIDLLIQSRQVVKDGQEGAASGSGSSARSEYSRAKSHDDRRERDTHLASNEPVFTSRPSSTSTNKDVAKTQGSKVASGGNKKKLSFGFSSDEDDDG